VLPQLKIKFKLKFSYSILEFSVVKYFLATVVFIFSVFFQTVFADLDDFADKDQIPEWSRSAIETLIQRNVLSGNSDGTFAPLRSMNRAEFCKIIVNATGVNKHIPLQSSFPDIKRDDWFFEFVETARHHGWISGYPDGTFQPGNEINRAEVAKILVHAFDLHISKDETEGAWFNKYFQTLEYNDLLAYDSIQGNENSNHTPSRSEISEQIFRFMKKTGRITAYDTLSDEKNEENTPETPPSFVYRESSKNNSMTPDPDAGNLYIEKSEFLQRANVKRNQRDILAHELKLQSKDGITEISGFQFRRVGNGIYSDFDDVWLEESGRMISERIKPYKDLVTIPLKQTKLTIGSSIKKIQLKVDMSQTAKSGNNSRWVLYLPEWIDSNTTKKIGFFPFGGIDIEVE
jgi:hypothetical protein